ncbi:MAG: RNA polymerase factor sigma-32 [Alphaproteobacteria bacterium]
MAHIDDPQTQKANISFIRSSMRQPILEREDEWELAKRWRERGDVHALHSLVEAYMRLVVAMAAKYRNYGLPMGDLVQEGNVGLMQAAARFEPEREVRFSTYASWWIRSAMQEFILRNWSIVRTGTTATQKSLFFNLRRLRAKIEDRTGHFLDEAGRQKIAKDLGVSQSDVEAMEVRLSAVDRSLDAPISDQGEGDWQSFLAAEGPTPEDIAIGLRDAETRSAWLESALAELSERERRIVRLRRLSEEGATLEELGRKLGVSKERVRQLEHRALVKLRRSLAARTQEPRDLLSEL